jgi:hypothetical protein
MKNKLTRIYGFVTNVSMRASIKSKDPIFPATAMGRSQAYHLHSGDTFSVENPQKILNVKIYMLSDSVLFWVVSVS